MADEEVVKQEELPLADKPADEPVIEAAPEEKVKVAAEEASAEAKTEPEPKPEPVDWRDKELKAKHRQLQDSKRKEAELLARAEAAEALAAKFNQGKQPDPPAGYVPLTEVQKLASEERAREKYIEQCNVAAQAGEKTFGTEWKSAIENLELKGGFDEQTMKGILATSRKHGAEAPAKILYELGKDPNRYDALMALPYEERIIEMADIVKSSQAKPVSAAPAPVSTVGGKAAPAGATLNDGMTDDQWFAIRRAAKLKKFKESHI